MNEITTFTDSQLPDTLEDLTQFVLVGKAKLNAYMMKLRTVNKLSVAQEIRDQTLKETQEISHALIAAEQRIGELLLAIPKATARNNPSGKADTQIRDKSKLGATKSEIAEEMGYSKDDVSDYQRMAQNPEIVQQVIDNAIANGEVVTKNQVMKEIKAAKDEARAAMQDLKEERDYLQSQLEEMGEREPETVYPDDYEAVKKEARMAKAFKADLKAEQKKADEKQKEILELRDRIAELESATREGLDHENLSENVFYFCTTCNNFIGNVGGLVWLTDRITDMPEKERDMFLKAARSFRDWAQAFTDSLERGMNG